MLLRHNGFGLYLVPHRLIRDGILHTVDWILVAPADVILLPANPEQYIRFYTIRMKITGGDTDTG